MFSSPWSEVPKSEKYVVFLFSYVIGLTFLTPGLNSIGDSKPQHLNFTNYSLSAMIVLSHMAAD